MQLIVASLNLPAEQVSEHAALTLLLRYWPGGQGDGLQAVWLLASWYLPEGQSTHSSVACCDEDSRRFSLKYLPRGQALATQHVSRSTGKVVLQ